MIKLGTQIFRITILALLFGNATAAAIINGENVEHSSTGISSSLVALQMAEKQPDGSTYYYKGTAFLIAPNLLLTAGHNVAYIPDAQNIDAIFSSTPCWGLNTCQERRVSAVRTLVHPLFRQIEGGTEYDLAVIRLEANAPDDYRAIQLNDTPHSIGEQFIDILGFGTDRESQGAPLSAFRLRSISLPVVHPWYQLGSDQKFWVRQNRGGICGGDSGGPAILNMGYSHLVVGLAIHVTYSDGMSHCLTESAFTDVLYFKEWIKQAVEQMTNR